MRKVGMMAKTVNDGLAGPVAKMTISELNGMLAQVRRTIASVQAELARRANLA